MEIRKIRPDERADFWRIGRYAFNFWTDDPPGEEDINWYELDTAFAGFDDGAVVSRLSNLTFQQTVRGRLKPMGGIAGVATLPTHRRHGYVRALMAAAFEDMRQKGQVVSALYPFRDTFYAAYGYLPTNDCLRIKAPSQVITHYLPYARENDGWRYELKRATGEKERVLDFLTEVVAPRYSGYVVAPDRSDIVWRHRMKDKHALFVTHDGVDQALACYEVKNVDNQPELWLLQMHWRNLPARDRLFGYLALHGEQVNRIIFWAPHGVTFQHWLRQPREAYEFDLNFRPMMVRVVDVAGALSSLLAPAPGAVTFTYEDPHCPWNNGAYRLSAIDGQLQAELLDHQPADALCLTVEGLSALAYGARSLAEVEHQGWITGLNDASRAVLASWFPETIIYNTYFF